MITETYSMGQTPSLLEGYLGSVATRDNSVGNKLNK